MKNILLLEYIAGLLLSMYLFSQLNYEWWVYAAVFFTPDISLVGYLLNTQVGAVSYNLFHHFGIAVLLYVFGALFHFPIVQMVGAVWMGHLFFDRIFGFGLKYPDNFKHTHLGDIK
jgi:hypothetical protein